MTRIIGWVLSVANKDSLTTARANQPIIGIDSKHGLQDDGAALLTSVSMNQDLDYPVAFTVMSKENTEHPNGPTGNCQECPRQLATM